MPKPEWLTAKTALGAAAILFGNFVLNLGGYFSQRLTPTFEPIPILCIVVSFLGSVLVVASYYVVRKGPGETLFRIVIILALIVRCFQIPGAVQSLTSEYHDYGSRDLVNIPRVQEDAWIIAIGFLNLAIASWFWWKHWPRRESQPIAPAD